MSVTDPQPPEATSRAGATFDAWYPRIMKAVGLTGVTISFVLWPFGLFHPVIFGAFFTLASGGFVGDAWRATRGDKE